MLEDGGGDGRRIEARGRRGSYLRDSKFRGKVNEWGGGVKVREDGWVGLFAPRESWPYRLWEMNNLMSPLQSLLDDDIRLDDLLIATEDPDKVLLMGMLLLWGLFDAQRGVVATGRGDKRRRAQEDKQAETRFNSGIAQIHQDELMNVINRALESVRCGDGGGGDGGGGEEGGGAVFAAMMVLCD